MYEVPLFVLVIYNTYNANYVSASCHSFMYIYFLLQSDAQGLIKA